MNIRTKIGACLSAVALSLGVAASGLTTTPAVAADADADGIEDKYEVSGWWNDRSDSLGNSWLNWSYPDYPLTCNTNPDDRATQVIWAYKEGTTDKLDTQANLVDVREQIRRVNSVFAASAKHVATDWASLNGNYTPRWVTFTQGGGTCQATFVRVAVPVDIYNDPSPTPLWNWLRDVKGYNDPKRKYAVLLQQNPTWVAGGYAQVLGSGHGTNKSVTNPNNNTSWSSTVATYLTFFGSTMTHEVLHSLGGINADAPTRNLQNGSHPKDCDDALCYGGYIGEVYDGTCGSEANAGNQKNAHRLDCHDDTYFNKAPASSNYLATHFNIATDSIYIWGGAAQPTSALPKTDPNDIVVTGGHGPRPKHNHAGHTH